MLVCWGATLVSFLACFFSPSCSVHWSYFLIFFNSFFSFLATMDKQKKKEKKKEKEKKKTQKSLYSPRPTTHGSEG